MENTKIIAKLYNHRNGQCVRTEVLHTARMEDGYISAAVYDRIKRKLFKFGREPKAHSWTIQTEDGREDTFGGYPASDTLSRVKFERRN